MCRTYPGQAGINPLPMDWGNKDFKKRGPVAVSRNQQSVRRRNGRSFYKPCFTLSWLTVEVAIGGKRI